MKYIIDLPDNCSWVQWVMTSDKDGYAYFHWKDREDLPLLDKELEEAYQRGLNDAWKAAKYLFPEMSNTEINLVFPHEWNNGGFKALMALDPKDAIDRINTFERKQESDEIKVGDIITDGKINYLVIDITDNSYVALQGTDFEPSYIGKDYIKSYHNLHDSKDMTKVAEEINRAVKGEQQERFCISCEHCNSPDTMRCVQCRNYDKWELKGSED